MKGALERKTLHLLYIHSCTYIHPRSGNKQVCLNAEVCVLGNGGKPAINKGLVKKKTLKGAM